jgi:hypothetical protein
MFDQAVATYPDQYASRSWFETLKSWAGLWRAIPYIPGLMNYRVNPIITKVGVLHFQSPESRGPS